LQAGRKGQSNQTGSQFRAERQSGRAELAGRKAGSSGQVGRNADVLDRAD
jgi:hypothetical protein